ncbi:c-type cytochrome [Foetidibacter luteolus]|uniref:c-type cytochrome n=1 Tax=Foetidibacter luteolus TaxID=2608880 RepID=UPI00129A1D09|nr:cytochrome c [Foetidibacter luteolus]
MNREINYILKGCCLLALLVLAVAVSRYFLWRKNPPPPEPKTTSAFTEILDMPAIAAGKKLFDTNCSACHPLFKMHNDLLRGIEDRVTDRALLRNFIRNSEAVIKSGEPYFVALAKEYGSRMPPFLQLSNKEIDAILDYIKVVNAYKQIH